MFTAFARALGDGELSHMEVRQGAVTWMRSHPDDFVPFLSVTDWDEGGYLEEMSQDGTWGDNLTLQALCAAYKVYVQVLKVEGVTLSWMEVGDSHMCDTAFYLYLENEHYENLLDRTQISN